MTRLYASTLPVAMSVLALVATGCASTQGEAVGHVASAQTRSASQTGSAQTSSARVELVGAVQDERRAGREARLGDGGGVLVVGRDVIDNCASVRDVHVGSDDRAWLALSKAIAHCINDGELHGRNIVLRGEARPQVVVKYMLTRLGVPEMRIDMSDTAGLGSCVQDCDADDLRVEIGVSGSRQATSATTQSFASGM